MAIHFNHAPSCTICGAVKREVNHWYLLVIGCVAQELRVVPMDADIENALADVADGCVCGEACGHKALARWFETRTLDAPNNRNDITERTA